MCQRDLKPGQPARQIRFGAAQHSYEAVHPEDWADVDFDIEHGLLGMDCARKLGLEWSMPE